MRASMDSEAIEEAATRWFAKRASGTWTEADQARFDAWLEASTAHRIQYLRVAAAWNHTARLKALGAGVAAGMIPPRGAWGDARFSDGLSRHAASEGRGPTPRELSQTNGEAPPACLPTRGEGRRGRVFTRFAVATATAAALVLFTVGVYVYTGHFTAGDHYTTPIGGIDTVALHDGSHVTLNTDTSIRVSLGEHERRIQLEKGEAFFEVAKDNTRPFIVYAGEKRVMAVGTKFSVRRDHDDIQVVVTEGRVKLAASPEQQLISPAVAKPARERTPRGAAVAIPPSTFLDAGAIARTQESEVLVRPDAAQEAEKLLSWRGGYVNFEDLALAEAVAEFNRYNERKIFIEDPAIGALRLSGNFRANNTDAFLWLIQSGFPITVEQSDAKVVLKSR